MRHSFLSMLAVLLVAASGRASLAADETTTGAASGGKFDLLRADLSRTRVTLRSLSSTELVARDAKGALVKVSLSDVLAIMPIEQAVSVQVEQLGAVREGRERSDAGWAILTDDQTIPGAIDSGAAKAESLGWKSPRWGSLVFSLEDVRMLRFVDAEQAASVRALRDDIVLLTNGDKLVGFVSLQAGATVGVETQPGKVAKVPLSRIAAIAFANPAKARDGAWIWLADGTAVRVDAIAVSESRDVALMLTSASTNTDAGSQAGTRAAVSLPLEQLLAYTPAHDRVVGLASLAAPSHQPWPTRRWTAAPVIAPADQSPLGASQIELPGPMSATWELPANVKRFAADVELPDSCRVWGDCTLIMTVDGKELARVRLTPQAPTSVLAADLPADAKQLTLSLDPGNQGSVEDRVVLKRAILRK
jgi:hypothetical protein